MLLEYKHPSKPKKLADEHFHTFSNNLDITKLISHNIINFQRKFDHRAYLHWYSKFGLEEDDMKEALENNYRIVDEYESFFNF